MTVWRRTAQSQSGNFLILQPRPHFEGCFATAKPPLGTWVPLRSAVRPFCSYEMGCENPPPLQNPPLTAKMLQASKMGCEIPILLPNDFQNFKWLWNDLQASKWLRKCSRHQNELRNSPLAAKWFRSPIATPCEIPLGLRKCVYFFSMGCKNVFLFFPLAIRWFPRYKMTSRL